MSLETISTKVKDFFKDGVANGQKAIELQTQFYDELFKSNAAAMAELADARMNNWQEALTAKTFSEFYECSTAFNEMYTEKMKGLYKENSELMEKYRDDLTELFPSTSDFYGDVKATAEKAYDSAKEAVSSVLPGNTKPAAKKPAPKKAASSAS